MGRQESVQQLLPSSQDITTSVMQTQLFLDAPHRGLCLLFPCKKDNLLGIPGDQLTSTTKYS